jgi:hypothetical protein
MRKNFDMIRAGFLCSGDKDKKKKHHLVNWQTACLAKDQGDLGVLDLEIMNIAFLLALGTF